MRRVARANLRIWWPELLYTAAIAGLCFPFRDGTVGFIVMMAFSAMLWFMGFRHRRLPLQATLDGVRQDVKQTRDLLVSMAAEAEPEPSAATGPRLTVVR